MSRRSEPSIVLHIKVAESIKAELDKWADEELRATGNLCGVILTDAVLERNKAKREAAKAARQAS